MNGGSPSIAICHRLCENGLAMAIGHGLKNGFMTKSAVYFHLIFPAHKR